jgi:hypothetical protein
MAAEERLTILLERLQKIDRRGKGQGSRRPPKEFWV